MTNYHRGKQLGVYLPDTDERAMGYLAGPSPNNWGILHDGRHISDLLTKATGSDEERRSHPLFGHVVLLVMQEVTILCPPFPFYALLCSALLSSLYKAFTSSSPIYVTITTLPPLSTPLNSHPPACLLPLLHTGGQQAIIRSGERGETAHI